MVDNDMKGVELHTQAHTTDTNATAVHRPTTRR